MTATRVITDHEELENSGQVTHAQIDGYINTTPWVVVSGATGPIPPAARALTPGTGVTITDNGPGNTLVVGLMAVSGSSGSLTPNQHELLRQLVHLADVDGPRGQLWTTGMFREQGPFPFPTASIWWTDSTRATKIMEQVVMRNSMRLIVSSTWRVFDVDGVTVVDSFTDLITYHRIFEASRTRMEP